MATVTSEVHPALAALDREQVEFLAELRDRLHTVAGDPVLATAAVMSWLDRVPTGGEVRRWRQRCLDLAVEMHGVGDPA